MSARLHSFIDGKSYIENIKPMVYLWMRDDEYLYIGSTKYGMSRIYNHNVINRKEKIQDRDIIHLIEIDTIEEAKILEQKLISEHKPRYNYHW